MKKYLLKPAMLLAAILLITACESDPILFEGSSIGFERPSSSVWLAKELTSDLVVPVRIMLIGAQKNQAISAAMSIDATSTAEPDQYSLSGTTFTIPAESSFGSVDLTVKLDMFEPGESKTLVLSLAGDNLAVNFSQMTLTITKEKFCPINDATLFTGDYLCNERGYGEYSCSFELDPVNDFAIWNDNFWDWPAPGAKVKYILSGDIDQIVTVPSQSWQDDGGDTYTITGTGTYDGCYGTMIVDYQMKYLDGSLAYTVHHEFAPDTKKSKTILKQKGL
jgi:hypothetical protein